MGRCTPRSGLIIVIGIAVYTHTHSLSLSYREARLRRSGNNWLPDGRMCITVTNVVIVIDNDWFATVRNWNWCCGSSRGESLVVRASFESSRHDNPIVYVGNAALIHPPAYNRALCFRLTSLTFKSTLLGSTRLSCFANLIWKLESIKRSWKVACKWLYIYSWLRDCSTVRIWYLSD